MFGRYRRRQMSGLFSLPAIDELADSNCAANAHVELFSNERRLQDLLEIEFRTRRRLLSQAPRCTYQERNFQGQRPRPKSHNGT